MSLPSLAQLGQLIHSPVDYLHLYTQCEREGNLTELLAALETLPFGEIREARRARILIRLGMSEEAKILLEPHLSEPLCLAWYLALLVREVDETQLRRIITRYPVTWPLNARPTNMEAKARMHIVRGAAFVTLNMTDSAAREFSEAVRLSELLGDRLTRSVAVVEFARRDLFNNKLEKAATTYRDVLRDVPASATIAEYSMSYLTLLHWLLGWGEEGLSDWARHALCTASLGKWTGKPVQYPPEITLYKLGEALHSLQELRSLCDAQMLYRHSPADSSIQQLLAHIQSIHLDPEDNEIVRQVVHYAFALALGLTGQPEALEVLGDAVPAPTHGILQLAILHPACQMEIQIRQQIESMENFQRQQQDFVARFPILSDEAQHWVVHWMQRFTPYALHVVSQGHIPLREATQSCLRIEQGQAFHQSQNWPLHTITPAWVQALGGPAVVLTDVLDDHLIRRKDKEKDKAFPRLASASLGKLDA